MYPTIKKNIMKKKLLLISLLFVSISVFSQGTCATAINISANGTFTTSTINGTYKASCFGTFANIKGNWYSFVAPSNGEISISSNLLSNDGVTKSDDTRLSIATGSCTGALTCVNGNDDIDTNYLSEVLNEPVTSGITYYIQWDSRYTTLPLDFTFSFTAVDCARPTVVYLPEYSSTSSSDLYWDQTAVNPTNYEVDWSTNFTDTEGAGTIVSVPPGALAYSTVNLSNLPISSNFRFFVRSNCGATQSSWSGPFYGYLPVDLPYSNDFEDVANNYTDGFINFTLFQSSASSSPANYADGGAGNAMYTFNSTIAASNARAYFRALSLTAGEQVTVEFKTRLFSTTTSEQINFNLTVGASQIATGQTTVVQSFFNNSDLSYTTHTASYTAPSSGIYYFGIHNNTPQATVQTFLFVDSIDLTTNLSSADFENSNFSVFPNPATDFLNVNSKLATIQSVVVSDINGRTIKNVAFNQTNVQVNVSDLNAGIYMVTINSEEGSTVKKFVKK